MRGCVGASLGLWLLAVLLGGCETAGPVSGAQPARVLVMKAGAGGADFRQIKGCVEKALDAEQAGERDSFLKGMAEAKAAVGKCLNPSSRYELSGETVYQFLADRLKDEPAYSRSITARELAELETGAPLGEAVCRAPKGGEDFEGYVRRAIQPEALKPGLEAMLAEWGEKAFEVDDTLVRHVGYFAKYLALCDFEKTNRAIERSRKYMPYIREVFARYDIHEDIAFAVGFVESRFTTGATSTAGAVGMFQFLAGTARDYGLRVDEPAADRTDLIDERVDWQKEAQAAARYLVRSRNVFASNVLALGAYHHGSDKVVNVLRSVAERSRVRCFSPIFEHGELGPFSREYIPQCLAAVYIHRLMKEARIDCLPIAPVHYESIREPVQVKKLSQKHENLLVCNPDLIHADSTYSYASTGGYALVTESGKMETAAAEKIHEPEEAASGSDGEIAASVTRGEASGSNAAAGQAPTETPEPSSAVQGGSGAGDAGSDARPCTVLYRFQRGNSLAGLARRFGLELKTMLDHPGNRRIRERYPMQPKAGEIVFIPGLAPSTTVLASTQAADGQNYQFVTVEDQNLEKIAREVSDALESLQGGDPGDRLAAVTPEDILYWNRDTLPAGTGIEDTLPAGIPLFIVCAYRHGV